MALKLVAAVLVAATCLASGPSLAGSARETLFERYVRQVAETDTKKKVEPNTYTEIPPGADKNSYYVCGVGYCHSSSYCCGSWCCPGMCGADGGCQ